MLKKLSFKLSIFLITILIIIGYFLISSVLGTEKFAYFKSILDKDQKTFIKKYFFPYKMITEQQQIISDQQKTINQQKQKNFKQSQIALELAKKKRKF